MRADRSAGKLIALVEPRSNTMRLGQHRAELGAAARDADHAIWFEPPGLDWDLAEVYWAPMSIRRSSATWTALLKRALALAQPGDTIVVMSNGGFQGLHARLIAALEDKVCA